MTRRIVKGDIVVWENDVFRVVSTKKIKGATELAIRPTLRRGPTFYVRPSEVR